MPYFSLPHTLTEKDLNNYNLFVVQDSSALNDKINVKYLEASDNILNLNIRNTGWTGYNISLDNNITIGYNLTEGTDSQGLTEEHAYSIWIDNWKEKERQFKKLLPLDTISQARYDALLSMYVNTGTFKTVGSEKRKFDIYDYIVNEQWQWVATAMSKSGIDRFMRQQEAKVMMLADYGQYVSRENIKSQGLQDLVKNYPKLMHDDKSIQQAEYVYFAETKRFLPNMSESRKRIISKQLG